MGRRPSFTSYIAPDFLRNFSGTVQETLFESVSLYYSTFIHSSYQLDRFDDRYNTDFKGPGGTLL